MTEGEKSDNNNSQYSLPLSKMAVREHMVNTAVNFLHNPKVQHSPLSHKRAFLLKKGLTEGEIDAAFQRVGAVGSLVPYSQHPISVATFAPPPPHQPLSFWSVVHRYGSAVIIIGVALYGLHQFYKYYIEPWLFGEKKNEDRMIQFEKQLLELNRSLSQLKRSVTSIEEALNLQKEQLHKTISEKNREFQDCISPSFFIELKADVATVKSLLLSRHQFPDVPKINPTIPDWQLINGSSGKLTEATVTEDKAADQSKVDANEQESSGDCNSSKSEEDPPEIVEKDKLEAEEAVGGQEEQASLSASSDSFEHCSSGP